MVFLGFLLAVLLVAGSKAEPCEEGARFPVEKTACKLYYSCERGVSRVNYCPVGLAFDIKNGKCMEDHKVVCQTNVCQEGKKYYYPKTNKYFYSCTQGKLKLELCPALTTFHIYSGQCVRNELEKSEETEKIKNDFYKIQKSRWADFEYKKPTTLNYFGSKLILSTPMNAGFFDRLKRVQIFPSLKPFFSWINGIHLCPNPTQSVTTEAINITTITNNPSTKASSVTAISPFTVQPTEASNITAITSQTIEPTTKASSVTAITPFTIQPTTETINVTAFTDGPTSEAINITAITAFTVGPTEAINVTAITPFTVGPSTEAINVTGITASTDQPTTKISSVPAITVFTVGTTETNNG